MTRRLKYALQWWLELLATAPSRVVPWTSPDVLEWHVFTDADGNGGIGAVLLPSPNNTAQAEFFSSVLPRSFKSRETNITGYERSVPLLAQEKWTLTNCCVWF